MAPPVPPLPWPAIANNPHHPLTKATAAIAELKEQSVVDSALGHADFLGQDAVGPDGKQTVDFKRGLTSPWHIRDLLQGLLGAGKVRREMSYWSATPTERMVELTASGALERGEYVVLGTICDTLWHIEGSAAVMA